ncbi:hypothetical protein IEU95_16355 [Hoyosella rhizosphaerae]|uniref:Heparin-binding hemagglutinin n=1 Tax=Hoyosella rhizosphaerae TaxID=1755582 RepID=A0A916XJB8_9ACTN|nr:hypothetical protein [Hoyosella rhizosphaerae]MBN4928407.1 hypothetical protein [Hoyosella rhizosphaerae]GGC74674.1 hypothetical protein GCM10011410_30020 [Hoyosella rhizosphaerae]
MAKTLSKNSIDIKAVDSVKTPLFVAVGAGDYAVETLGGFVKDLRRFAGNAATDTQARLDRTRDRLVSLPSQVPSDLSELRGRLSRDELKKQAEAYVQTASETYSALAERGETRVEQLRLQPLVETRVNDAVEVTGEAIEELTRRSRLVRELALRAVTKISGKSQQAVGAASEKVSEVADKAAESASDVVEAASDFADEAKETLAAAVDSVEAEASVAKAELKAEAEAAADAVVAKAEEVSEAVQAKETPAAKPAPKRRAPAKRAAAPRRASAKASEA